MMSLNPSLEFQHCCTLFVSPTYCPDSVGLFRTPCQIESDWLSVLLKELFALHPKHFAQRLAGRSSSYLTNVGRVVQLNVETFS